MHLHWAIQPLISQALQEDIGPCDWTTEATVPPDARCAVTLRAKQAGVLSGIEVFRSVFEYLGAIAGAWRAQADGSAFAEGDVVASFKGHTAAVLSGERVALNFIQRLSGIATLTAHLAEAVGDTGARICDTRKTTPLLRSLEKAAVAHGGGSNHRFALYDGILIKENHITAAGGLAEAVRRARAAAPHLARVEVEVTTLTELETALESGAEAVLLDNMDLETLREASNTAHAAGLLVEASGNITLDRVRAVAETGVDLISVGALTHSAPAVDLSLLIHDE